MRNMRIWARLLIGFLGILLIISIAGMVSLRNNQHLQEILRDLYLHPYTVNNSIHTIMNDLDEIHHLRWAIIFEGKKEDTVETMDLINNYETDIRQNIQLIREKYLGKTEDVKAVLAAYNKWENLWDEYDLSRASGIIVSQENNFHTIDFHQISEIKDKLKIIQNFADKKAEEFNRLSEEHLNKSFLTELYFFLLKLLVLIFLGYWLLRSIVNPIHEIVGVAEKIRNGDLESRCDERYQDEIGKLGRTLNNMTSQLIEFNRGLEDKVSERTHELEMEIEERRIVQEQLEANEKLFRSIFEADMFGMIFWDKKGNIIKSNDAFLKIIGYDRLEYESSGLNWHTITPEEYLTKEESRYSEYYDKGFIEPYEKEYYRKDGSRIPILAGSAIINEEPFLGIAFILDISRRKTDEKELADYRKNLEEKVGERTRDLEEIVEEVETSRQALTFLLDDANESRNEVLRVNKQLDTLNKELEAFSYSVSHDLKAPLRAIDGFSKAVEEDYSNKLDEDGKEFLSLIRKNAQKMGDLINDLLEFSRLGRKEMNYTEIDMQELVQDVYEEQMMAEQGREIEFRAAELSHVFADRSLMRQVLVNLLSNAIKFTRTKENSIIEVGCRNVPETNETEFYVRDNGVGFDMNYYNKLFGVFQRLHTDEYFEGTGVGLALTKRIIAKHKGSVWAAAEKDIGATFYFTLPKVIIEKEEEISLLSPQE